MPEVMTAIEDWAVGLVDSWWILLVVLVLATIDGFFPPVPSESVVITVAVLTMAGEGPSMWLLIAVAAAGAFCGDLIAYTIGSKVPIHRLRVFQGRRGQASLAWASRALARRGTVFILSARFVPIGRVAVNMTAGAVGYPRQRFAVIAAIAAVVWGGYSTLLGMGAGVFLHEHPLVGVLVGVTGGVLLGFLVDAVLRRVQGRFGQRVGRGMAELHASVAPTAPSATEPDDEPGTAAAAPTEAHAHDTAATHGARDDAGPGRAP